MINTFPYSEDFEANNGGWYLGGTFIDWQWGTPNKAVISGAASGVNCWVIGGLTASFYNYDERSTCTSPCFDFTNIVLPYVTFNIFWESEKKYDGATFQYSLNQGSTWFNVGKFGDAVDCFNDNWFNEQSLTNLNFLASIKHGWSGNIQPTVGSCIGGAGSAGWITARHTMPYLSGKDSVIFRFAFGSGSACNDFDGFAFDDVWIGETPVLFSFTPAIAIDTCSQGKGQISVAVAGGLPPYSYQWSNGNTGGNSISNLFGGTYTVTVNDVSGCTASQSFIVGFSDNASIGIASVDDTCNAGKGTAMAIANSGTAPFTFSWTGFSSTFDTLNNISAGTYQAFVYDSLGCIDSTYFTIGNINNLTFEIDSIITFCFGIPASVDIGVFDSYLWSNGNTTAQLTIENEGTYIVTVTNQQGCTAEDSLVAVLDCDAGMIVPNTFTPNDDNTNEVFLPQSTFLESYNLKVFNRFGTLIFETNDLKQGWNGTYQDQACPTGVYGYFITYKRYNHDKETKCGLVRILK